MHDDVKVVGILKEIGFTPKIYIDGEKQMTTINLYGAYLEGESAQQAIQDTKEKLYALCIREEIGTLDFFMIDATEAEMFKSIYHDGKY
jgi:predicted Ser/Thr protein kinase